MRVPSSLEGITNSTGDSLEPCSSILQLRLEPLLRALGKDFDLEVVVRFLGWVIVILAVLYTLSWGCHDAAVAIGRSADTPPQGFALLVHSIFGSFGVVVCGLLAIPYVLMHEGIPNDTLFVCIMLGVGLALAKLPRRAGAASSSHGH